MKCPLFYDTINQMRRLEKVARLTRGSARFPEEKTGEGGVHQKGIYMEAFVEALADLLMLTAWKMDKPQPYGWLHLCVMLAGFPLSAWAAWKLRRLGERGNRILLLTVGLFLLFCEAYKQLFYELVLEPDNGYRWSNFPFHLCSVPMYLCLLILCLKDGPLRKSLYTFLMSYNLLGGAIAFAEPSGLLHGRWTLTMHAFIWHMVLVFLGLYIGFSGRGGTGKRDYWHATAVFLTLCAIAFAINCTFWEISGHTIKMFFLGPAHSPIAVFKDLSKWLGWPIGMALYIPSVAVGAAVVLWLFRLPAKRCRTKACSIREE